MNSIVKKTYTLLYNPFKLAPILIYFFANLKHNDPNSPDILLAYLVFPLVLYPESRALLQNVRSNSTLAKLTSENLALAGLPDRIHEFKNLTNLCLQHAIDHDVMSIQKTKVQIKKHSTLQMYTSNPEVLRATKNFAKLCNLHDVVTIYKLLGVRKL